MFFFGQWTPSRRRPLGVDDLSISVFSELLKVLARLASEPRVSGAADDGWAIANTPLPLPAAIAFAANIDIAGLTRMVVLMLGLRLISC